MASTPSDPLDQVVAGICGLYRNALQAGLPVQIGSFLDLLGPERQDALFRGLLQADINVRKVRGERVKPADYRKSFPGRESVIRELLSLRTTRTTTPAGHGGELGLDEARQASGLVLGLLAVRNGLIDENSLVAAITDWARASESPFGEILERRGALSPTRRTLLDDLAAELDREAGGPEAALKRLTALSQKNAAQPDQASAAKRRSSRKSVALTMGAFLLLVGTIGMVAFDDYRVRRDWSDTEDQYAAARKALYQMMSIVADSRLPASEETAQLRSQFSDLPVVFMSRFLAKRPDDPALQYEAARVFRLAGDIQRPLGKLTEAIGYYGTAGSLFKKLLDVEPENPAYQTNLGSLLLDQGRAQRDLNRDKEAQVAFEAAVSQAEQLLKRQPGHLGQKRLLASGLIETSRSKREAKKVEESRADLDRAIDLLRQINPGPNRELKDQSLLCLAIYRRGTLAASSGAKDASAARTDLQDAIAQSTKAIEANSAAQTSGAPVPTEELTSLRLLRARAQIELAKLSLGKPAEFTQSMATLDESTNALKSLHAEQPNLVDAELNLTLVRLARGELKSSLQKTREAMEDLRAASDATKDLEERFPGNPRITALRERIRTATREATPP
jgi:tetratricopeptide (TPR) repeat protein